MEDLLAVGGDLEPGTLLDAYRHGAFPMPVQGLLGWWSPDPRGILPLDGLRVTRSLEKSCRRFELRVDTAFDAVIEACADPRREGGWISDDIRAAYRRLHRLGWAHSVEAWDAEGYLAGGLYGVAIGGLFAGESMFHRARDASKVALVGLVEMLLADGHPDRLLDVQWATDHLVS
ncbi:MAG TPA: leucyl/phenylalanyl-tRNA--protein transferase, partial [Acidimicrobiia bacterium]|nr:leucyl/phenylalanyl-tRNA--protein transferase [Acidimicrobiia bacterium]